MENIKSILHRDTACQSPVDIEAEVKPDQTGNEMTCIKKNVNTFNNTGKLPQKNSGFEKKVLKGCRTKPPMLGNMTFREIAEKRKDMLVNGLVKKIQSDTPSLAVMPSSELSLKPDKREEEASFENVTTYINPHLLVGKTITLKQGDIRRIKFLSQDSNSSPSNSKLLKLDALQLTPKIIVRKSKPGLLSKQTPIYDKGFEQIHQSQKKSESIDMSLLKSDNSTKSLPHIPSLTHVHNPSNTRLEKELVQKYSGLVIQNDSYERDIYESATENVADVPRAGEEYVPKCSLLNSSHDNLTILSQVACGQLEMNKQLSSKGETNHSVSLEEKVQDFRHRYNKSNYEYVSIDHSYGEKGKTLKELHFKEQPAKVRPINNNCFQRKQVGKNNQTSLQKNEIKFKQKPMFAWCTQYITHSKSFNTSNNAVVKRNEPTSKPKKPFQLENKNMHPNNYLKGQSNLQKQADPHKNDKISISNLNNNEIISKAPSLQITQDTKISNGLLPSKSQSCREREDKNNSCAQTLEVSETPFFSGNQEKKLPESDEVVILKEILVSKSLSCNALPKIDSNILKQIPHNTRLLCPTQRNTIKIGQTLSLKKVLKEIPVNKEQTSKTIIKGKVNHEPTELCSETPKKTGLNLSSHLSHKDMNGNKKIRKNRKTKSPLKAVKSQTRSLIVQNVSQKSRNIHRLPKSVKSQSICSLIKCKESITYEPKCKPEDITKDTSLGQITFPIKECFVLLERLNESIIANGKDIGIAYDAKSSQKNETFDNCFPSNMCSEKKGEKGEVCLTLNTDGKFRDNEQIKDCGVYQEQLLITSCRKDQISELIKVERNVSKPKLDDNVTECHKTAVLNEITSTRKTCFMPTECYIDNNKGRLSTECIQEEGDDNNSKTYLGNNSNLKTELKWEETKFNPKNNTKAGCKRKKNSSDEDSEGTQVKRARGRPKKLINKNKAIDQTLRSKFIKKTMAKENKPKTTLDSKRGEIANQGESNNNTKNEQVCGVINQSNMEVFVSNRKGKVVTHSPEKAVPGNRELYSLLTDFTTLGCSIGPNRKLRNKPSNILQGSVQNLESVSDQNPSQICNSSESSDTVIFSKNIKQVECLKTQLTRNLRKNNVGIKELKRQHCPLSIDNKKRKHLDLSRTDIEKKPDSNKISKNVTIKSNSIETLEKYSCLVSNTTQLPCNRGKKKLVKPISKKTTSFSNTKRKELLSTSSSPMDSAKLRSSEWNQEYLENAKESVNLKKSRCQKKLSCNKTNGLNNKSCLSPKVTGLQLPMRKNDKGFNKSPFLKYKQKSLEPTIVVPDVQTTKASNLNTDSKICLEVYVPSEEDSSKSRHELSSLNICSAALDLGKVQSKRVRRVPFNSQTLKLGREQNKLVCGKSKSNRQTVRNRNCNLKVTEPQDISEDQSSHNNLTESNSTKGHVQKKENQCDENVKDSELSSAGLKKPTQLFSPTNNRPAQREYLGNKLSVNNESHASPPGNTQPIDSHKCINRQVSVVKTNVNCTSSSTNSRQEKGQTTNNLLTNQSIVRDNIHLLIMEQLKRSKRGHKIVIENALPKR